MHTTPAVILTLYTRNTRPYTIESYSTTVREFLADALLRPVPVAFEPQREWLTPQFQVDNKIK
jgi:hypothetical protein